MAKGMFKDFTWRNQPGGFSPGGMEDYVAGKNNNMGYTAPKEGGLSILGSTLSGIGAAFAGDTDYNLKWAKQRMEQENADREFYALLAKNQGSQDNTGAFVFDPVTRSYKLEAVLPKGSIVRNAQPSLNYQVEKQQTLEQAKGVPAADYGRLSLAKESLGSLDDVDKILFPKGSTDSFRRDVAGLSNLPLLGGPAPFNKDAQKVHRKLGTALAARQLIQTGVASNADERRNLANQFLANFGSDPEAFREGLGQLKGFYKDYQQLYKTKGIAGSQKTTGSKKLTKDSLFEGL